MQQSLAEDIKYHDYETGKNPNHVLNQAIIFYLDNFPKDIQDKIFSFIVAGHLPKKEPGLVNVSFDLFNKTIEALKNSRLNPEEPKIIQTIVNAAFSAAEFINQKERNENEDN